MPSFWVILLCQVLWGIGATFTSGADEAWIADEMGGRGLDKLFLKGAQIRQIGSLLAILVSTLLGTLMINLPMLLGGALFIALALFLLRFMPETAFRPAPPQERSSLQQMLHTFRQGLGSIRKKHFLMVMAAIALFYGLYSEGLDRLWIAHILDDVTLPALDIQPIVWVGLINGVSMVASILAVEYIKRNLDRTGKLRRFGSSSPSTFMLAPSSALAWPGTSPGRIHLPDLLHPQDHQRTHLPGMAVSIESGVRATVLSTYVDRLLGR